MSANNILYGIGGLAIGLIAGVLIGGGISETRVREAVEDATGAAHEAAQAAEAERTGAMTALGERIAALEAAVSDTASRDAALKTLEDKMAAVEAALSESAGAAEAQAKGLKSDIAALGAALKDAVAPAAPAPAPGTEPAPAASAPAADLPAPEGYAAGDTAIFSDGAFRVFVSRVDDPAGTARLSLNGTMHDVAAGDSASIQTGTGGCTVSLDAIDRGHATLSGSCDSEELADLPTQVLKPGHSVPLAEGQLSVFLSSVTPSGAARIAVNGVEVIDVDPGGRADATASDGTACRVYVTATDEDTATVAGTCG